MGLFTPDWNSKDPEKRMNAVKNTTGIEKLQKIAENAKYEDVRQEAWKRIALEAKDKNIRKAAIEKITDQDVLRKMTLEDLDVDVRMRALGMIVRFNYFDESELIRLINTLAGLTISSNYSEVIQNTFSKISTPSVLFEYQYVRRNEMFDKLFLSRIIELAKDDAKLFRQFQAKANSIIKGNHTDGIHSNPIHQDQKQQVVGSSSDCHNDTIPWKPTMTGFGHGYHQDGFLKGESKHQDFNPLSSFFQPYFLDEEKYHKPVKSNTNVKSLLDSHEHYEDGVIKIAAEPPSDSQDYYEDGTRKINADPKNNN